MVPNYSEHGGKEKEPLPLPELEPQCMASHFADGQL
jgi:hypothetical protein